MTTRPVWFGTLLAVAVGASACIEQPSAADAGERAQGTVAPSAPVADSAVPAVPAVGAAGAPLLPEPAELATVAREPVQGWTGPGGAPFVTTRRTGSDDYLSRQIGRKIFALPLREPARTITQYPCASCHQGASVTSRRPVGQHENIRPVHPSLTQGACATCHVTGAVDRLALVGGGQATLNQPYRLCAQCHSHQVDAWAAGHHGKRLDGWAGARVVLNCTDCHDPHDPRTQARIPFAGARLPQPYRGAK